VPSAAQARISRRSAQANISACPPIRCRCRNRYFACRTTGRNRLCHFAAVQYRSGCGHHESRNDSQCARPEPWRSAYVEPSVRPDDSRYGENPNRLQTHTQFQVILSRNPQSAGALLRSLSALGIDVNAHDVRFVEDNWAQPRSAHGALAGRSGWTASRSRSSPTFNSRWHQSRSGSRGDHLRPGTHPHGHSRCQPLQGHPLRAWHHLRRGIRTVRIRDVAVLLGRGDVDATRVLLETYSKEASDSPSFASPFLPTSSC